MQSTSMISSDFPDLPRAGEPQKRGLAKRREAQVPRTPQAGGSGALVVGPNRSWADVVQPLRPEDKKPGSSNSPTGSIEEPDVAAADNSTVAPDSEVESEAETITGTPFSRTSTSATSPSTIAPPPGLCSLDSSPIGPPPGLCCTDPAAIGNPPGLTSARTNPAQGPFRLRSDAPAFIPCGTLVQVASAPNPSLFPIEAVPVASPPGLKKPLRAAAAAFQPTAGPFQEQATSHAPWKVKALSTIAAALECERREGQADWEHIFQDVVVLNGLGKEFPLPQFIRSGGGLRGLLKTLESAIIAALKKHEVKFDLAILSVAAESLQSHALRHGGVTQASLK